MENTVGNTVAKSPDSTQILVVEDYPDIADMLRVVLGQVGYIVEVAYSLQDAREILSVRSFDLLVCDIVLPDGKGWDLVREVKAQRPVKAIALTALSSLADIEKMQDAGFDRFLQKPANPGELRAMIQQLLRENGPTSQPE